MKKISNLEAKTISVLGINSMALISGLPFAWFITIPVSIAIICKKETPHDKLVTELSKSFKMDYSDAERYAQDLEKICKKEYKKQLEQEMTIFK